jgi:hypothetical protein
MIGQSRPIDVAAVVEGGSSYGEREQSASPSVDIVGAVAFLPSIDQVQDEGFTFVVVADSWQVRGQKNIVVRSKSVSGKR